jgi:hypothetical protein
MNDHERAKQLGRELTVLASPTDNPTAAITTLVREGQYDLLIVGVKTEQPADGQQVLDIETLKKNAPCRVFLGIPPALPTEPEEQPAA